MVAYILVDLLPSYDGGSPKLVQFLCLGRWKTSCLGGLMHHVSLAWPPRLEEYRYQIYLQGKLILYTPNMITYAFVFLSQ
ncbi:uncharacterized protein BYT42DRAFT_50450 [Radiomyces spectabilis]|uniref:uncharacterized protein n=1 Tax=Radiomyces spectabilis TaxID=64574 RepID=UPI002220413B|nr:uncharacterized protein BYT42DRAFT_50450 [Radiomyces spectabilis]KAI8372895.1 hypothetical protein BYT42DRAFT_50450 [Radiomyces spectabilis]